jgi:ParB family chromosome partitioning protein
LNDQDSFEIALIENIQREDLNPLEEAEGYRRLVDDFSHTQEAISRVIGKSRSHIANIMRLLNLPDVVKQMLVTGDLSVGHARALLNAENPEALARQIIKKGLNVRQAERLVTKEKDPGRTASPSATEQDPNTAALETDLSDLLGLKVSIKFHGSGGELVVHYKTLDQLDDVLRRLKSNGQPL